MYAGASPARAKKKVVNPMVAQMTGEMSTAAVDTGVPDVKAKKKWRSSWLTGRRFRMSTAMVAAWELLIML